MTEFILIGFAGAVLTAYPPMIVAVLTHRLARAIRLDTNSHFKQLQTELDTAKQEIRELKALLAERKP